MKLRSSKEMHLRAIDERERDGNYKDAEPGASLTVTKGTIGFSVASYFASIHILNGTGKIGASGMFLL